MATIAENPGHDSFSVRLAELYADFMGWPRARVDIHWAGDVLTAVLFGSSAPAEDSFAQRPEGRRVLRDFHDACARELFAPTAALTAEVLGRELVNLVLEAAPPTESKVLVLVLAPGPKNDTCPQREQEGERK